MPPADGGPLTEPPVWFPIARMQPASTAGSTIARVSGAAFSTGFSAGKRGLPSAKQFRNPCMLGFGCAT